MTGRFIIPSIRKLQEEGKARLIGITIHRDPGHEEMMTIMRQEQLDFIQVNYNVMARAAADEVLPLAGELGVAVMVNVPFCQGRAVYKDQRRSAPRLGVGLRHQQLGAVLPEIRGFTSGGYLCHSAHG